MKILLDSSGLDKGPDIVIEAAKKAKNDLNIQVAIVGLPDLKEKVEEAGIEFVPAETEITPNHENPALAIRREKTSTIVVGLNLLKEGSVDAFVSGGSTGAVLAGGMLVVGRLPGVKRAALSTYVPTKKGYVVLIDMGANVDVTPDVLYSFGVMAKCYAESILNIENPRISLLNNGAEEHKGNALTKEAYQLFKNSDLNFVGNMEARYIFDGDADVVVMDGFAGNAIVKALEGGFRFTNYLLKSAAKKSFITKIGLGLAKVGLKKEMSILDSSQYGGVPLLGLKKPVIKAHGSSDANAIYNSIIVAKNTIESNMIEKIEKSFKGEE